jgi:recombination protein RecA
MGGHLPVSKLKGVFVASQIRSESGGSSGGHWCLDALAGRLVEISGAAATASLTAAASLILEAQRRGEPAAWVAGAYSTFFPPDFAVSGIDLDALPVVRVPDATKASGVADQLLRSGGFAIVVLDLGVGAELPIPIQTRLLGLAKKHHTVLLCITRKEGRVPSLGSLVSIRGEIQRNRTSFDRFTCELRVIKDKRRGPGWGHVEICRGPGGLC